MTLLPIADIDTGERYRKDMGDLPALAASIDAVGLLHPVVVMGKPDGGWSLVAGERRLRACRDLLRWERIHVRIVPATIDLLRAERDENEVREPFTPSEAVAIAAALRPSVEAEARERQEAARFGGASETDEPQPSSETDKGRTDDRRRYPEAVRFVPSGTGTALAVLPGGAPVPSPVVAQRRAA